MLLLENFYWSTIDINHKWVEWKDLEIQSTKSNTNDIALHDSLQGDSNSIVGSIKKLGKMN